MRVLGGVVLFLGNLYDFSKELPLYSRKNLPNQLLHWLVKGFIALAAFQAMVFIKMRKNKNCCGMISFRQG